MDYASDIISKDFTNSSNPLKGLRVGMIKETLGEGVDAAVTSSIQASALHLEALGCVVTEVFF